VPLPAYSRGATVKYHWEWQAGVEHPVYKWSDVGRRLYQWKWGTMFAPNKGKGTVEAGYNAIHHCAEAMWFEWSKGLAPLFWSWRPEYQRNV
jgi:hypothetical protein